MDPDQTIGIGGRDMRCRNVERVKPLDELLDDKITEFESGYDRECDKELDTMVWELGGYENETPPHEAAEYEEDVPIEEELVEGEMVAAKGDLSPFRRSGQTDEAFLAPMKQLSARSLAPETRNKRKKR
jgi:hypothetical protein